MTNLGALRLLPAEQMAEFLTKERVTGIEAILDTLNADQVEDIKARIKAMYLKWLNTECEL